MQLLSSLSMCMLQFSTSKLKNLQNEYDKLKETVMKSKKPILTNKKQTNLIRRFLGSDKKVRTYTGLPNRSVFDSLLDIAAYKAQIMLYWGGCGKVCKFWKSFGRLAPLRDYRNLPQSAVHHCRKSFC